MYKRQSQRSNLIFLNFLAQGETHRFTIPNRPHDTFQAAVSRALSLACRALRVALMVIGKSTKMAGNGYSENDDVFKFRLVLQNNEFSNNHTLIHSTLFFQLLSSASSILSL